MIQRAIGFARSDARACYRCWWNEKITRFDWIARSFGYDVDGTKYSTLQSPKMGLVDRVVPNGQLLTKACELLRACIEGKFKRKSKNIQKSLMTFAMEKNRWGRKLVFDKAREKVMEQSKGMYPAPLTILEVVAADSDEAEAKGFGDLLCTPESKGLRHLFDCITECKKAAGGDQSDNTDDEKEEMTQQRQNMWG